MVVIIAFTLGIFGGIYMVAVFVGMMDTRLQLAIGNEASHIQVHNPSYLDNNELKYTIDKSREFINSVEAIPEVRAVSPRIKILGMASTSGSASGVMINGIIPERERQVTGIAESIVTGGGVFFDGEERKPVVIGEKLAKNLKLTYYMITQEDLERLSERKKYQSIIPLLDTLKEKRYRLEKEFDAALAQVLGPDVEKYNFRIKAEAVKYNLRNRIVLSFQALDGHIAYDAFRVTGVYKTGNSAFDGLNLYVRDQDIREIANLGAGQFNEMAIMLTSIGHDEQTKEAIQELKPDLSVQKWDEVMPEAGMYTSAMNYYLMIFMVIILLALGFGIVNTMLMAVLERIKELGMLKAVGMSRKRIFRMIMLETVFLGLVGSMAGMAISYLLIWWTGKTGLDLSSMYQAGFEAIGFSPILYPAIGPESFFQITLMVIITGVIASIYPARKALKLNPSEALRIDM
jgi:ABC-type lipoprotein release transport system permease subunit